MADITTSGGAPMDPEAIKRRAQADPGFFQQLMSSLGLGGGGQPGSKLTGDVGLVDVASGSVGPSAGAARGGVQITGTGGGAGGAGGGGRPPITGLGATPPAPGGGSGPLLSGLGNVGNKAQQAVAAQGGVRGIASKGLGLAGKYGPLIGGGLALAQGDVLGAAGTVAGGLLGGAVGGPVGSIIGATIGGGATKALAGGAAKAVEAVTGAKREAGQSGVFGGSIPGLTAGDLQAAEALRSGNVKTAEQMLPLYQQYRGVDMQNQMQLNQQLGQLTGALNRQMYAAQLAGGSQQQAGQTVRDILASSNPYAASVFRAG